MYCLYYTARLERTTTWFVTGILRAENHLVFDRALEDHPHVFEFFVPPQKEEEFLDLMSVLIKRGNILSLEKKENRLEILATKTLE